MSTPIDQPVLVIFCKRPLPGQGKQRIAATLGTEVACDIATALLHCALEDARCWPGPVVLSPVSEADRRWAEGLLERDCLVVPQCEGNLGDKLNDVDRQVRAAGYQRLLFIGTDAPEHTEADYQALRELLAESEVVLRPAADGGVTAMGCAQPWPELGDLPWSTEALGDSLAAQCRSAGFQVAFSQPGYDVDNQSDLIRLKSSLQHDLRPARQQLLLEINSVSV